MFNHNTLERDIERLSREVQEKKNLPENKEKSEKEIIKQTIGPLIQQAASDSQGAASDEEVQESVLPEYLKESPEEIKLEVEKLVDSVFHNGLAKTASRVRKADPFVLDAFHDALTDKLYEELKKRKLI